jgi:hypothetical protein
MTTMTKPIVVFDTEVYKDYFLVMFRSLDTHNTIYFEMYPGQPLDCSNIWGIFRKFTVVSFNGNHFDMPVLAVALSGGDNALVKKVCDAIIELGMKPWQIEQLYGVSVPRPDHIDLFDVAPGMASLKAYGGRMHCRKIQDLPLEPTASISPGERKTLIEYCANDLETTEALYRTLAPQLKLRETLGNNIGEDLRSKSDAGIAEVVLKKKISDITAMPLKRPEYPFDTFFCYRPPLYIGFETPVLQQALETIRNAKFAISEGGKIMGPEEVESLKIPIGNSVYRMGIGGLHSTESSVAHVADDDYILVDRDVASFYPAIILQGLYPGHLGPAFLTAYRAIVKRRLQAKARGEKAIADSLKIVINSSFGKMGNKWSALYSPHLMIQVTMTGQLALLMLIEWLERHDIQVVSANTDGVVIRCHRRRVKTMESLISAWECWTGFDTEVTRYKAIYSRDVNNYIALRENGGYKVKGVYTPAGLQKNPVNLVCVNAVLGYLQYGIPLEKSIRDCRDIRQFVTVRTVKGGAVKGEEFLGRAVRWYYAIGATGAIHYKINGHKVPLTDGAKPLMELPSKFPDDLNYEWYIQEAGIILNDIGYK